MTTQDLKQKLVIGLVECGSNMIVGDLVKIIPSKYNKYIQDVILEKELIGIVVGIYNSPLMGRKEATRKLVKVQWSDGSSSEINAVYLEVIDEQ